MKCECPEGQISDKNCSCVCHHDNSTVLSQNKVSHCVCALGSSFEFHLKTGIFRWNTIKHRALESFSIETTQIQIDVLE